MSIKLTYEFVKTEIEKIGYELLSTEYENCRTKLKIRCDKGHVYSTKWCCFQQKCRCPDCLIIKRELTYEFVKSEIEKVGYRLLSEYKNSDIKLKIRCDKGHIYLTKWGHFQQGHRCRKCSIHKRILTHRYVSNKIKIEGYKLLSKYKNSKLKMKIKCNKGHIYYTKWNTFHNGKRCPICSIKNGRHTIEYIKEETKRLEKNYECISEQYHNAHAKLKFKCSNDHEFAISWSAFYNQEQRCQKCSIENRSGNKSSNWKGGVTELNLPLYDTYAHQIDWCESVRKDPENNDLLQVKCTESSCRKWFTPTTKQVGSRIAAINGRSCGSLNFYCSEECKQSCSLYDQVKYPKGFKHDYYREVQSELRYMVLERDNYECQRCGAKDKLQCHHYESIYQNPIMSADVEMCVTLCTKCHKLAHKDVGCRPIDLTRESLCKIAKAKGETHV